MSRGRAPSATPWHAAPGPRRSGVGSSPWSAGPRSGQPSSPTWGRRSCGGWTRSRLAIRSSGSGSWSDGCPSRTSSTTPKGHPCRQAMRSEGRRQKEPQPGPDGPRGRDRGAPRRRKSVGTMRPRRTTSSRRGPRLRESRTDDSGLPSRRLCDGHRRSLPGLPVRAPFPVDKKRRFAAVFSCLEGRSRPQVLVYLCRQALPAPHYLRPAPRPL
jgi:hypothetical protein